MESKKTSPLFDSKKLVAKGKEDQFVKKIKLNSKINSPIAISHKSSSPQNNLTSKNKISFEGKITSKNLLEPTYKDLLSRYLEINSSQNSPKILKSSAKSLKNGKKTKKFHSNNCSPGPSSLNSSLRVSKLVLNLESKILNNSQIRASSSKKKNLYSFKLLKKKFVNQDSIEEEKCIKKEAILQGLLFSIAQGRLMATNSSFYLIGKQLGKGAFGKVYLGLHRITGLKVAIKTINKSIMQDENSRKKIFQEVLIMKKINHINVIRILEVFESSLYLMIVLEYCGGGDLLEMHRSKKVFSEKVTKNIFSQVVNGVKACHLKNIIHRDIKLDNLLMTADYSCIKICDFGVSRIVKPGERVFDQCGTPAYLPPEIILNRGYEAFFVDIWSMGVLLFVMLVGVVPFKAENLQELHKTILRGKYELPENLSENAKDLIKKMLNPVPHLRISLDEIKEHSWFFQDLDQGNHEKSKDLQSNDLLQDHIETEKAYDSKINTIEENLGNEEGKCKIEDFRLNLENNKSFIGKLSAPNLRNQHNEIMIIMKKYGFSEDFINKSLKSKEINHVTATYFLLEISNLSELKT